MRGVAVTRREIKEEWLIGGGRVLRADPVDGAIGQIANQDVVRVVERAATPASCFRKRWVPLVGVAAEEAVEVLESHCPGPLVVGPARTLHPLRNEVVLAEPCRVVAVVDENVADRADTLGDDRGVARITRGELRDVGHPASVVVAAGQQPARVGEHSAVVWKWL